MADRNQKEQLGARTRFGVRDKAVAAAEAAGISLNEWVERVILAAVGDISGPIVPHPDQIPLIPDPDMQPGVVELRNGETTVGRIILTDDQPGSTKKFASDCSLKEYHWKHGLGNPCRRCGGETP